MNEYLVLVTGNDGIGYTFIKNVIELANMGAILEEGKVPTMRFPFSAWMYLKTDELMESKPGFQFQVMQENFTREQLDDMEWSEFKAVLKRKFGIGGRNREQMTREYLKAVEDSESNN